MPENPFPVTGQYEYMRSVPVAIPRVRRKYALNVSLFLLTILTTLFWGAFMMVSNEPASASLDPLVFFKQVLAHFELLQKGIPYSVAILLILLSHEMGHYLACRYYGIDATLPFFLPGPVYTGTFGAFIRIRSPFPNRKSLFDVGIAGPLAGFAVLLPFLYLGLKWSLQIPPSQLPSDSGYYGEPLIFQIFGNYLLKPNLVTIPHPIAFAAWFACLATSLNLLPISQLDGGHVSYALFGKRAYVITWIFFAGVLGLAVHGFTISWVSGSQWVMYSIMLLALRKMAGFRHPPTMDDESPIGWGRMVWGVIGLIVFILTFIPVTIRS
jgi:membrane-associated protease RseP (regulator of RpoE activity)